MRGKPATHGVFAAVAVELSRDKTRKVQASPLPEFDLVLLAAAAAALLAGGLVKGIIGIGTPLVVIPVLTIFVDVKLAVQLMALPLFLSNVFQGFRGRDTLAVIGRLAPATIGLAGGIVAGVMLAGKFPDAVLLVVAGAAVSVGAAATALAPGFKIPASLEKIAGFAAGALGGVLGGLTTLFGPAVALYLTGLRLSPADFVKAVSILYTVGSGTLFVAVLGVQSPAGDTLLLSLAACLPLLIGMVAGARIRGMLPQAALRLFVLAVIFVGGANMILRGI
jgi:uncharacterized membrane protein YfcA